MKLCKVQIPTRFIKGENMNIEIMKILIEIAKFYYMDVVVMFLLFFIGIGMGIALNELFNEILKRIK